MTGRPDVDFLACGKERAAPRFSCFRRESSIVPNWEGRIVGSQEEQHERLQMNRNE